MPVQKAKGVDPHDTESLEAGLLKELALRHDGVPTLPFVTVSGVCHVVSAKADDAAFQSGGQGCYGGGRGLISMADLPP
jgi:hypothetical protein